MLFQADMDRTAVFSPCRTWRYRLGRVWDEALPAVLFVMLNPSRANERIDDRTVKRTISFAKRWGYGRLLVGNLYAFRTPYPKEMLAAPDPIGPENDQHIAAMAQEADQVIAAWGVNGAIARQREVLNLLGGDVWCIGKTKHGHPRHPLFVRGDAKRVPFKQRDWQKNAKDGGV